MREKLRQEETARIEAERERQRLEQEKEEATRRQAEAVELAEALAQQELQKKEATVAEAQSLAAKEAATRSQLEVTVQELQVQLNAVQIALAEKDTELKKFIEEADREISELKQALATKNAPPSQAPSSRRGSVRPK